MPLVRCGIGNASRKILREIFFETDIETLCMRQNLFKVSLVCLWTMLFFKENVIFFKTKFFETDVDTFKNEKSLETRCHIDNWS